MLSLQILQLVLEIPDSFNLKAEWVFFLRNFGPQVPNFLLKLRQLLFSLSWVLLLPPWNWRGVDMLLKLLFGLVTEGLVLVRWIVEHWLPCAESCDWNCILCLFNLFSQTVDLLDMVVLLAFQLFYYVLLLQFINLFFLLTSRETS